MLLTAFPKGCKHTTISRRIKSHTGLKILRPRRKLAFQTSLPFDVMSLIFNNLDESSTKNLSCVSRFFNSSLEHKINKFKEEYQEEKIRKLIEHQKILEEFNNSNLNYHNNDYQNNYYYEPYWNRNIYNNYHDYYGDNYFSYKYFNNKFDNILEKYGSNIYNTSKRSKKKYSKSIQKDFNMLKNIHFLKKKRLKN